MLSLKIIFVTSKSGTLAKLKNENLISKFKNAKNIVNVIENISLEYILLETDSPYLAPVPYRGQVNSPCNIPIIAKRISEIKNVDLSVVSTVTTSNAVRLFDI